MKDIIQKGENQEVEFKESFSRERAANVICGFISGKRKKNGISGLRGRYDGELENLVKMRSLNS